MFLRTERLFLRPAWPEDAPELARAIAQEPVVRMLARVPWPYDEDHAREWIDAPRAHASPTFLMTLPEAGGKIVGACGLHATGKFAEVGYWVEPGHWGRGYATEALNGLIALSRMLGHARIVARHAVDNPASARVMRKAGFRPTGRVAPCASLGRATAYDAVEHALDLQPAMPVAA
jgi:RimJ/RimL family protein N-acetyltransferase